MRYFPKFLACPPWLALTDLLLIHAGFSLALFLKWGPAAAATPFFAAYWQELPAIGVVSLIILRWCGLYAGWLDRSGRIVAYSAAVAALLISAAVLAGGLWEGQPRPPAAVIGAAALAQFVLLAGYRLGLRGSAGGRRRRPGSW